MGLDFAVDALYKTGWNAPEVKELPPLPRDGAGRPYPSQDRVESQFAEHGFTLAVHHVQLFGCYRAVWDKARGNGVDRGEGGAVVGASAEEAAVYALSQFRRQIAKSAPAI